MNSCRKGFTEVSKIILIWSASRPVKVWTKAALKHVELDQYWSGVRPIKASSRGGAAFNVKLNLFLHQIKTQRSLCFFSLTVTRVSALNYVCVSN